MDRQYLAKHRVTVFAKEGDTKPVKTVHTKPYSSQGFDNYMVDGRMYPGFRDKDDPDVLHAWVFLDTPLKGTHE